MVILSDKIEKLSLNNCIIHTYVVSLYNHSCWSPLLLSYGHIISIILTSWIVGGLFNFVWSTDWVRINLVDLFLDWILKGLLYIPLSSYKIVQWWWSAVNIGYCNGIKITINIIIQTVTQCPMEHYPYQHYQYYTVLPCKIIQAQKNAHIFSKH